MPSTPLPRNPRAPFSSPKQRKRKILEKKVNNPSPLPKSRPKHKRVSHPSPCKERRTFFEKLNAIREESPTLNRRAAPLSPRFRDIRDDTPVLEEQDEDMHVNLDSDDSFFWEEEHTLLSDLMEDGSL
ncbi:hypothetical protein BDQ17DRAFT_1341996 [Cyathus striatus]|nr:hypothetical protein BDQ17DRAFT_1341996 [Cyathus striatus]